MIDRNNSVPLYLQVKQWLVDKMDSGEWKEGDMIQPERELAEDFGMNRLTVRQAITELVSEGRVVRTRGRGTFVSLPKIQQSLGQLTSFTEDMRRLGMVASSRVLKLEIREATSNERAALSLPPQGPVLELNRLRLADGIPMALENAVLRYDMCEKLTEVSFVELQSLYVALKEKCGLELIRAQQTIETLVPPQHMVQLLKSPEGAPVLKMTRRTFTVTGTPVEWVTSFYRGDRYRFESELLL
jgi:GntR family transcriptional regulator